MKLMFWRSGKRAALDAAKAAIEKSSASIGHGRKLPLGEFLTSPFFLEQVWKTLQLLKGFEPKAQQIILITALREVERELPPGEKRLAL